MTQDTEAPSAASDLWSSISAMLERVSAWWERNGPTVVSFLDWASGAYPRAKLLEATGWLPHYTTPELDLDLDAEATDARIAAYYLADWPQIEAAFRARLETWRIDDEAKACFGEALSAHRQGLYRVAPRLLFPEIERLAQQELGDVLDINAGQRDLRHAADELGATNFTRTGILSLRLFDAFAGRIYAKAKTPEELERVRADPVPNRHAAVHGLAVYKTQKTSLNALIIAEFVLLTIDALKAERARAVGGITADVHEGADFLLDTGFPWTGEVAGGRSWDRTVFLTDQTLAADKDVDPSSADTAG